MCRVVSEIIFSSTKNKDYQPPTHTQCFSRDSNMTHQETKVCWGSKPDSEIALEVEIPRWPTKNDIYIYRFPKEGGCKGKGVTGTLGFVGEP